MIRTFMLGLALALGASLADPPAAEASYGRGCSAAVDRHLTALGVDSNDVERVLIQDRRVYRRQGTKVVGYDAWIDLKSCNSGQLVISMNRQCSQKTAYTTGGCQVPGIGR